MMFRSRYILAVLLLLASGMEYYFFAVLLPRTRQLMTRQNQAGGYGYGNDFYQIWITTRELLEHRSDPYTPATRQRIEIGLYGRSLDRSQKVDEIVPYRGYTYPLVANLFAAPLGLLSFRSVQIILSLLLPCTVVACIFLWCAVFRLRPTAAEAIAIGAVTLSALPVLEGIYALQPTLISAVLIAASVLLLQSGKLAWAGVLLAIGWAKPQLIVLLALWLALWTISDWARRKTFLLAFAIASAVLFAAADLWLPGWSRAWLSSLSAYRQVNSPPLFRLVLGTILGRVAEVCAFGLAIVTAVRWRGERALSRPFLLVTVLVLATAVVTISSSIAVYDQFLLLPALLLFWVERRSILQTRLTRFAVLLTIIAFAWPWFAAPLATMVRFIVPPTTSARIILLPLVTASSFPLLVMIVLAMLAMQNLRAQPRRTNAPTSGQPSGSSIA